MSLNVYFYIRHMSKYHDTSTKYVIFDGIIAVRTHYLIYRPLEVFGFTSLQIVISEIINVKLSLFDKRVNQL